MVELCTHFSLGRAIHQAVQRMPAPVRTVDVESALIRPTGAVEAAAVWSGVVVLHQPPGGGHPRRGVHTRRPADGGRDLRVGDAVKSAINFYALSAWACRGSEQNDSRYGARGWRDRPERDGTDVGGTLQHGVDVYRDAVLVNLLAVRIPVLPLAAVTPGWVILGALVFVAALHPQRIGQR